MAIKIKIICNILYVICICLCGVVSSTKFIVIEWESKKSTGREDRVLIRVAKESVPTGVKYNQHSRRG